MLTNRRAEELRERIPKLTRELEQLLEELKHIEATCQHRWSKTVYDPVHTEGYRIPGDKPGTMGSDWRGPVDVPASTKERWKRVCEECGKTEYTENSRPTGKDPVFS